MNAKYKMSGTVPQSLGRPVGVLPLGPRPAIPPGQKKSKSYERRQVKRTPSTGSITSLNSVRSVQSDVSTSYSKRSSKGKPDSRECEMPQSLSDDEGQDVRFIDCDSARPVSNQSRKSSARKERKTFTTQEIMDFCQETDPYKVYEVDLHGTDLTHIPDLEKFRKLRLLDASGNHIKKIMGLELNKELRDIKLYDNEISIIDGLENLKDLCNLQLQHNKISVIGRGLGNLKKLQSLRLDSNKISKIETPELLSCSAITVLDLSNNKLETLAPLSYLPNLEELYASGNLIGKIGDLSKCKKLQEVDLSRNRLFDLLGIANLPNLKILDASQNQLTCLKSVGKLRSLEELNINANRVSSLSSFANVFPKLQILFACDNMISSWDEICSLSDLAELVELFVSANPFTMEDGEMPTYHLHVTMALPNLEVIDGAQIKRPTGRAGAAPVMRPMSASSIISVRQVDSQLKSANAEQETLQKSISDRFDSLRSLFNSLPSEAPQPPTDSPTSMLSSRCSSRLRIKEAQQFAAANFDISGDDDL
ncbi:protein phosphatase 1 regulatory subunit 7 [Aplysia californica]|uniref:Protein phosphatase 1 regulatory subunit 7 n=1 Tax=Aplysia californica TaxID=6500 RepID=A0ABM0JNW6_APLCA|nr:protein phosphatase 1 regulatory subunit 7 [Aplysia californica]